MRTHCLFHRSGRVLLGAAIVACLMHVEPGSARTQIADPEADREAKRVATATFLDRSRPEEERLAALKNFGYPEAATTPALLALGTDRTQSDTIRWEALRRHPNDDRYLDAVLKILNDPRDGGEELDANLIMDLTRRTTFRPPPEILQRIQSTLRGLLADRRDKVRLYAFRASVAIEDPVAVNLLAEALRRGRNVPIPLADAIDLLDQDGPANHIGALRPYLDHADPRVQAKAARALAVDPQSRPRIVELATSPGAPEEVRLNALRALAREDSRFASYAIPLVESSREDAKIRYAAMQTFAGRMNYNRVEPSDQVRFAEAVERLAVDQSLSTDEGQEIKEAARQLHLYLRKAFPEVQKHYEKR